MADGSMTIGNSRITEIVRDLLAKRAFSGPIGLNCNLNDAGLTSLDMVNLMLAIEAEYDIEIPQAQMKPENFRSIQAIETLVNGLIG